MDHFPKLEAKSVREVPYGACVAFAMSGGTYIGIALQPYQPGADATIAALWTSRQDGRTPGIISVDAISGNEVVVFPAAKVILPQEPAHVHFRYREHDEPFGALFLADGEPYAVVRGMVDGVVAIRLRDGGRANVGFANLPWFSPWTIASPDIDGRWSTLCTIERK